MNKCNLIFLFCFISIKAVDASGVKQPKDQSKEPVLPINIKKQKKQKTSSQLVADKELLLFLAEFSDAQGNWVDPEIFNQETSSHGEQEEKENEDHHNNL